MKKSVIFLKAFLCVVAVFLILSGITLLVIKSSLETWLTFGCVICAGVLLGLFFVSRECRHNDEKAEKSEEEKAELQQEINALKEKLKNTLPINPSSITDDRTSLLHKCAVLEEFRNSFPYSVSDKYVIYNVMRTEIEVSRFSRWQIVGAFGDELWQTSVIRPDTQTYKEMLMLISATKAPQEITGLNMPNDLLWQ